jgi:hypothetical protein
MQLAISALPDHPVRTRTTVLADPLDKSVVRLDHSELVGASVSHFVGNCDFCVGGTVGVDAVDSAVS